MNLRDNIRAVARGRPTITDEEAERVRAEMRRLRDERYDRNEAALGRALGFTQSAVWQVLNHRNKPSLRMVRAVAKVLGVQPMELLDGARPPETDERYPPRERAIARLRGLLPTEVEETVRSMRFSGEGPSETEWIRLALTRLEDHEMRARMTEEEREDERREARRQTGELARVTRPTLKTGERG
jgi:transcriptional regulator with XRE-family HTH domain